MGFRIIGFPPSCHPNYGALTSTPAGLTPAEHTSLHWTHIDAQHFHHLGLKVGVTAFQVVTDLVGLDLLLVEDDAQRALSKFAQATVPLARPMFAHMGREQPRRPQFVGIAELLGLAAGQIAESPRGIAPRGAHRSVREPLDS